MTAITNLPDLRPSLLLDFANSGRVDPRIQCTRASSATCFGPDGKLRTVPANMPRINYDPATGKCLGLLSETQSTNLIRYSEDMSQTAWMRIGISVTPNYANAPDGSTTANLITATVANPAVLQHTTAVSDSSKSYYFTVFAKLVNEPVVTVNCYIQGFAEYNANFNLATQTVSGDLPFAGQYIFQRLADGWFRIGYAMPKEAVGSARDLQTRVWLGTRNSGAAGTMVLVWGAQLEESAYPTSYIKTGSAAATRSADIHHIDGLSFAQFYNQEAGTLVVSATYSNVGAVLISLDNGHAANRLALDALSLTQPRLRSILDSAEVSLLTTATSGAAIVGFAYKKNDFALCANGGALSTSTSANVPPVNTLRIGNNVTNQFQLGGHISRLAYYPQRLTNAQLQRLTA